MYCNKCGAKLRKDSNFCHICGNKVQNVEIYIQKKDEQLPDQIGMKELFNSSDTKEFVQLDEKKKNKFSDLIHSFRSKTTIPDKPLEGDNEISIKLDSKIEKIDKEEKKEPIIDFRYEKNDLETDNIEIKEKSAVSSGSVIKRFFDYMREEEVYDESLRKKKSGVKEITEEGFEKDIAVEVMGPEEALNEEDKTPINLPNADEVRDEKIKILFEDDDFREEEVEKTKSPSMINKVKDFLAEEDEDNLLDLSPEEYREVMYGQGSEKDLDIEKSPGIFDKFMGMFKSDDTKDEEIEEISDSQSFESQADSSQDKAFEEKSSIFDSIISFFKGDTKSKEEVSDFEEETEDISFKATEEVETFEYADKGKTIRYSKKIIDSYLNEDKDESSDIKEDIKAEIEVEKEHIISQVQKEEPIKEIEEIEIIDDVEETKEPEKIEYEFLTGRIKTETKDKEKESFKQADIIIDKPVEEDAPIEDTEPVEKGPGLFAPIIDFFKSIGKFFTPSTTGNQDEYEKDNIDIILNSSTSSMDTMPLVLSEEEKKILNDEITKRQGLSRQEMALKKSNAKVTPVIRSLIALGAKIRVPLLIISLGISLWTISWSLKNPFFIGVLGVIKFFITYLTIFIATNSAFNSIGLRLKRSVVSLFILLQMLVYQIFDAIYIKLTMVVGPSTESIIHVFSPKIFSILFFIVLAFMLLLFNYKKVSERNKTMMFLGWYIVTSATITLMVILLELLLVTIMSTLFIDIMF